MIIALFSASLGATKVDMRRILRLTVLSCKHTARLQAKENGDGEDGEDNSGSEGGEEQGEEDGDEDEGSGGEC